MSFNLIDLFLIQQVSFRSVNGITNNPELSSKWEKIIVQFSRMLNNKYNERPTSAEILSHIEKLAITPVELKNCKDYHNLSKVHFKDETIFTKYFKAKIISG